MHMVYQIHTLTAYTVYVRWVWHLAQSLET